MNDVAAGGDALGRLADLAGILPAYTDTRGEQHATSAETKRALLGAMGIAAQNDADVVAELTAYEAREWRRQLAPVAVFPAGDAPLAIEITVPIVMAARTLPWLLTSERGEIRRRRERTREILDIHEVRANRSDSLEVLRDLVERLG